MKRVAYTPLDLPRILIDETLIKNLVNLYDTGHHDGLWKCLPLIGRVNTQDDFEDADAFEKAWEKRYFEYGDILYNENVYEYLKPLFDHIETLPLKVTHAQILNQTAKVGKHYDLKNTDGKANTYIDDCPKFQDHLEPVGYKILLNCFDEKSFYVSKGFGQSENYIQLPPDTNTFVINEKTYPHGAEMTSKPKYIVSIFGIVDEEKHFELIRKSMLKYKDYYIMY